MRSLLHSRQGAASFATVMALLPLIGAMALGGEAATWYATKQHAQIAADAAAYAAALRLACETGAGGQSSSGSGSGTCPSDAQLIDYRGKEFAAQNGFCATGDTTNYPGKQCSTSLPADAVITVAIDRGSYSNSAFTAGAGNAVRATITQQQSATLAKVLGLTTVTIAASAVALVQSPGPVCGLGLNPNQNSLTISGNVTLNGSGCGLQSDGTVKFSSTPTVPGSGWAFYGVAGCNAAAGTCNDPGGAPHNYYMPTATNPLSKLDTKSFNSTTGSASTCKFTGKVTTCNLAANPSGPAYGNLSVTNGNTLSFSPGVYFFYNASLNFTGGTVNCVDPATAKPCAGGAGVNIVLLGNSSLNINGATVSLPAGTNNTGAYADLNGVLIDDQAPTGASNKVTVNGNGLVQLDGIVYFPKVDVSWAGTTSASGTTCAEVIANTLTMTGSAYFNYNNCGTNALPQSQYVALVQ